MTAVKSFVIFIVDLLLKEYRSYIRVKRKLKEPFANILTVSNTTELLGVFCTIEL
jgi:hypothetical protein